MLTEWINGVPIAVAGTKRVDVVSATTIYVGEAVAGAPDGGEAWQIKRIDTDVNGNVVAVKLAEKNRNNLRWTDRAGYTYY